MAQKQTPTRLVCRIACLVLLGLLGGSSAGVLSQEVGTALHLPLIYNDYPPPPPSWGVQMSVIDDAHGLQHAIQSGTHWVRYVAFEWDQIEPVRATPARYEWHTVDEQSLRNAHDNDLEVLAIVLFAPTWARLYPDSACGPIDPGQLERYGAFLSALVQRYKDPPYNVKHWELGNEPDMQVVNERRGHGCWGEDRYETFGGEAYGEMLKLAYPAIKAADPEAQVLIGGLLLDCDPAHPPEGQTCPSGRFLEGILDAGAGNAFDVVSYHGYAHWNGTHVVDVDNPNWQHRGGVSVGKAAFLREMMARYTVDKPLMLTEGSLIYPRDTGGDWVPPDDTFYDAQAEYVVRLYVRNWANEIEATIWYTLDGPGWRYGSLLDAQQAPRPAYEAYRFMIQELGDAWYEGPVTRYVNLEGYAFGTPEKRTWVLWPPQDTTWNVVLPSDMIRVYDKLGQEITPSESSLTLTGVVYVELAR